MASGRHSVMAAVKNGIQGSICNFLWCFGQRRAKFKALILSGKKNEKKKDEFTPNEIAYLKLKQLLYHDF